MPMPSSPVNSPTEHTPQLLHGLLERTTLRAAQASVTAMGAVCRCAVVGAVGAVGAVCAVGAEGQLSLASTHLPPWVPMLFVLDQGRGAGQLAAWDPKLKRHPRQLHGEACSMMPACVARHSAALTTIDIYRSNELGSPTGFRGSRHSSRRRRRQTRRDNACT